MVMVMVVIMILMLLLLFIIVDDTDDKLPAFEWTWAFAEHGGVGSKFRLCA